MDFEDICQIVDTVVDLPVHSKSALLHDLAHRAALVLKVDDDTVFSALLKREELGSTGVGKWGGASARAAGASEKAIRNIGAIETADRFRRHRWATR
jgi:hypothetical protein